MKITLNDQNFPIAVEAAHVAPRSKLSIYPEPFASRMKGREKRALGDVFGLVNFGVNLTSLLPVRGQPYGMRMPSKMSLFTY